MDSLSAVLCPHLLFPSFSLYLLSVPLSPLFPLSLFFPHVFLFSLTLFHNSFLPFPPSFTLCCLVADGNVGQQQQQQQQSRSQSVSRRWGEGEGGCGKRRKRKEVGVRHMESLVKGPPQRECVCACGSVW